MTTKWVVAVALLLGAACGGGEAGGNAAPAAAEDEPAQVEIVGVDFGFEVEPEVIPAGDVETTLVNEGKEPHQAGYYRLNDGVEYEEFVKAIIADASQIPQLSEGGRAGVMRPVNPGDTYSRPGDELEPGTYALLCSVRDPKTGKNHYELGMVAKVVVE